MDRIERIMEMEARLDRVSYWLGETEKALDGYEQIRDDLQILSDYYGSRAWREDYEADEAGMLPHDLKRGVLSEDGIDHVILQDDELQLRMRSLADG